MSHNVSAGLLPAVFRLRGAMSISRALAALVVVSLALLEPPLGGQQPPASGRSPSPEEGARFKSGVDLINVTATVSDASGRFVSGLRQEDFLVYDDDQPVEVTSFSPERVPVSLGIALDTSGSMAGEKIHEAESALDRFLFELLDREDEIFLYRFSSYPILLQGWTKDREALSRALGRIVPNGGTAMYDTVAEALPIAQKGQNPKKALLLISDGNDTTSHASLGEVRRTIRESEVLVYAIGIDGEGEAPLFRPPPTRPQPQPPRLPIPWPFPPLRGRGGFPQIFGGHGGSGSPPRTAWNVDRVNVSALRELTDDSGGRTEIIRTPRDLEPSTASIADELSKQYNLGYPASGKKDGRWHAIRVEMKTAGYHIRARRGYVAN
jgi:Ca-activated chloride channel family protein